MSVDCAFILLREIDVVRHERFEFQDRIAKRSGTTGKATFELTKSHPVRHPRPRINEVADCFSLQEIHAAVHHRATSEFTRKCLARTSTDECAQHERWNNDTAMDRELDDILTRVALWAWEDRDERLVQECSGSRVVDLSEMSGPRSMSAEIMSDTGCYIDRITTAQTNDRDRPTARGSSNCGNGVVCPRKPRRSHGSSGEGERLAWLQYSDTLTVLVAGQSRSQSVDGIERARAYVMEGSPVERNEVTSTRSLEQAQRIS